MIVLEILGLWGSWLLGMGLGHLADVSKTSVWKYSLTKNAFLIALGLVGCVALGLFGLFHIITCLVLVAFGFLGFHALAFAQRKRL